MIDEVIAHYKYLYQKQLDRSEALQKQLDDVMSQLEKEKHESNGGLSGLLQSEVGQQLLVSLAPSLGKIAENLTKGIGSGDSSSLDYLTRQPEDIKNVFLLIANGFDQIHGNRRNETLEKINDAIQWGVGKSGGQLENNRFGKLI